ncbi:hypothetical protein [Sphingobium mellinum]|uniref:hypothetical protein n=1 Tax=Sphingobium mellinum TaxID=1387166 RepID=UPI0030EB9C4B
MIARLSNIVERGIWGVHIGRYDFAISASWVRAVPDHYMIKYSRLYKFGRYLVVISALDRHG